MPAFIELPESAFPNECDDGMLLRDYFAAKAMQGAMGDIKGLYDPIQVEKLVECAYGVANAMMKKRKERK